VDQRDPILLPVAVEPSMGEHDKNPRQDWDQARQQQDGREPHGKGAESERERQQPEEQSPGGAEGRDEAPRDRGRAPDAPWLGGG
jgi:hypothetical protein